ncbi:antibiotic biosynthesis monooxygenase [Kribbella sp. GL6]|uniref:antibiotic biosynthesis monooxygenase n=1 Tax=Kribbella sp. GL6 TaxID=3419765 RepID=UPI003D00333F
MMILTEVSATVEPDRVPELLEGFRKLAHEPRPDGLLQSRLLQQDDTHWRIQTLWRDRAALDTMRTGPKPPAAPALLAAVGGSPTLTILTVHEELHD